MKKSKMTKKGFYNKILESYKKGYGGPFWRTFSFIRRPQKPLFAKWVFQKKIPLRFFHEAKSPFLVMRSSERPLF